MSACNIMSLLFFTAILVFSCFFLGSSSFNSWTKGQRLAVKIGSVSLFIVALLKLSMLLNWDSTFAKTPIHELAARACLIAVSFGGGVLVCLRIWRAESKR
jgi:hypothetical protein